MRRASIIAAIVATVLVGAQAAAGSFMGVPAGDASETGRQPAAATTATGTDHVPDAVAALLPEEEETEPEDPHERPQETDRDRHERLRLACEGTYTDHDGSAIMCRWSPTEHPEFVAYRLWRDERQSGEPEMIHRTEDRREIRYVDTDVQGGAAYAYGVQAVDDGGRVVAAGGPTRARAPEERPSRVEELRLACRGAQTEEGPAIVCRWSRSRHPDFAGYVLWRADRQTGEREVVHRTDERSETAYAAPDVRPGGHYVYMLGAVDADGELIGRGGPARAQAPESGPGPVLDDRIGSGRGVER